MVDYTYWVECELLYNEFLTKVRGKLTYIDKYWHARHRVAKPIKGPLSLQLLAPA